MFPALRFSLALAFFFSLAPFWDGQWLFSLGILMRLGENPNFKHSEILSLDDRKRGRETGVGINLHAREKGFEEKPTKDSMNGGRGDRYILNLIASWPCHRFSILILRARSARKGKLHLPLQHGLQRNQHHFSPRLHIQLPSPTCLARSIPSLIFPPRLAGPPPIRFANNKNTTLVFYPSRCRPTLIR